MYILSNPTFYTILGKNSNFDSFFLDLMGVAFSPLKADMTGNIKVSVNEKKKEKVHCVYNSFSWSRAVDVYLCVLCISFMLCDMVLFVVIT